MKYLGFELPTQRPSWARISGRIKREMVQNWHGYLLGTLLLVPATLAGELLKISFSPATIDMVYLLCILLTAIFWGLGPSILVSILSVLAQDYFFVLPYYRFGPIDSSGYLLLGIFVFVSAVTSYITSWARRKTVEARDREWEATTLYNLSQELASINDLESCAKQIEKSLDAVGLSAVIFLPSDPGSSQLKVFPPELDVQVGAAERAAAAWCYSHAAEANPSPPVGLSPKAQFAQLITARGIAGVMSWEAKSGAERSTPAKPRLISALLKMAAVTIENIHLAEAARHAEMLKEKEKLQTTLLHSVSHDLRTPLVSVMGVLDSLRNSNIDLDEMRRQNLVQVAYDEAERLNRLVANLLDISRIEAGAIKLSRQASDPADLISVSLDELGGRAAARRIEIDLPAGLPFAEADFRLVVLVLINLLENALKYSENDSPIEIGARSLGGMIEFQVADRGIGIPSSELSRVFEKFYRVPRQDNRLGVGLGLSICKGIVEAHGGSIAAENRPGGGTLVRFTLPAFHETG